MAATKADLFIDQGTTFSVIVKVTDDQEVPAPVSLQSIAASAQMRRHYTSNTYLSFTTAVAANTGTITLSLTANQTGTLEPGRYVYDVELTDADASIIRILEGMVTVTPQVTR